MRTNWFGKTVVGMSLAVACAVPACDTSKTEDVARTTQAATSNMPPGDVAITCFNGVSVNGGVPVDFLQLMPLRAIDKDTDLRLTDREATATGEFNTNDEAINEPISLLGADAGVTTIEAGTPILFTPATGLSANAETVFIYQGVIGATADAGTLTGGSFLWGLQNAPGGAWAGARDDANNLSARLNVLAAGDNDTVLNQATGSTWFYDTAKGPASGTKAVLRAAIHNPLNWTLATTAGSSAQCPKSLNVLPDAVDGGGDVPVGTGGTDGGGAGGAAGSIDAGGDRGGVAGAGAGGTAGSVDAGPGTGGVAGSGTGGVAGSGTGGVAGSGTGGVAGSGTGGVAGSGTDAGPGPGTGGVAGSGTDAGPGTGGVAGTGAGGSGTGGVAGAGAGGTAGSAAADAGVDVRPDAGNDATTPTDAVAPTDVKADTGTGTDVKPDTGTGTDAKADAAKTDAGKDTKAAGGGGGGCGCSTTSTRESLGTGAWMMALAGIVFTARRRRRKQ